MQGNLLSTKPEESSVILQTEVCFLTSCKDQLVPDVEKIHLGSVSQYVSGKEERMVGCNITLTNIPTQPVFFPLTSILECNAVGIITSVSFLPSFLRFLYILLTCFLSESFW